MHPKQLLELIKQCLTDTYTEDSPDVLKRRIQLVFLTICVESDCGYYLKQTRGPALGICQMEPNTFTWLLDRNPALRRFLNHPNPKDLVHDLFLAVVMCAERYKVVPKPLPDLNDIQGMAAYWKQYYNTPLGAGTIEDCIKKYDKYSKGLIF